jgi:hypothetical protein
VPSDVTVRWPMGDGVGDGPAGVWCMVSNWLGGGDSTRHWALALGTGRPLGGVVSSS